MIAASSAIKWRIIMKLVSFAAVCVTLRWREMDSNFRFRV